MKNTALRGGSAIVMLTLVSWLTWVGPASGSIFPPNSAVPFNTLPSPQFMQLASEISPIVYPQAQSPFPAGATNWDGQGALPGAFAAPWSFASTNFDPRFKTSYWSDSTGFIQHAPNAPWNLGSAAPYSEQIFQEGMKYVGDAANPASDLVFATPQTQRASAAR